MLGVRLGLRVRLPPPLRSSLRSLSGHGSSANEKKHDDGHHAAHDEGGHGAHDAHHAHHDPVYGPLFTPAEPKTAKELAGRAMIETGLALKIVGGHEVRPFVVVGFSAKTSPFDFQPVPFSPPLLPSLLFIAAL